MTPLIDGNVHHFEFAGLYDGVSILRDYETGSIWNHISGEAMHGPLAGSKLPTFNLLHMNVEQALAADPDRRVAVSDRPITGRPRRWSPWLERIPVLGARFRNTMAPEDTRRPTLDVGLGVWTERVQRYYPMEHVAARNNVVMDQLDGRSIAVFYERGAHAMMAVYVDGGAGAWEGDTLRFDSGAFLRDGMLYTAEGERQEMERPMQLFTRWYGYALTFPQTEVYEP